MVTENSTLHVPVLSREILHWLAPVPGGVYVDATLGLGGHSGELLRHTPPVGGVYGFEWDKDAAILAGERLGGHGERFHLVSASYANLVEELERRGIHQIDGLIADLGVSSLHLDRGERGFTFRQDAPLDMRMNQEGGLTAAELVARLSEAELADVFYHYGEERQARRIARYLVEARAQAPVVSTGQLAEIVARAIPLKYHPKKIHVATKVFQALRIAVNGEFDNILRLLTTAPQVLAPGARICIISFHSLEDRMVKKTFSEHPAYQVLTRKPVQASVEEVHDNPRSRSAKLRVAQRTEAADRSRS
ncbi:16S rRNA (cytosine(1402)-N(4))-methyltransferase RsmH [Desulfogranum mediterraneum]|uniref:16S rRNA (cytosine(1402)-N(4))-methyltransferase RsmH n=1 Tax=Desulfogranum mediterraneum TaxID=160661 RepID=UPI000552282A|nr:16S rRNA (cytosine(1402)-N(4))-methyltransferase RsmH [Desulfogranum mediterraneum]